MEENKPVLDKVALEGIYNYIPDSTATALPNVPFKGLNNPLPTGNKGITPSALNAIENHLMALSAKKGMAKGSISRSLAEVSSNRYDSVVPGDYNNEDAYAQGQGFGDKMVNGVGKGLLLTGTTFLQSTVGLLNGLAQASRDGRAASFYDNEFNRVLDELNKKSENALPHYYKDIEKNARWYSPTKLVTGNFFWNGIIKNLGFAAGAALSGGMYASILKALPLTSRLFSVGKAAEALAATEEGLLAANKVADTYGKIKGLSDTFLANYKILNTGGRALVAGLATTGEAGFEAFHNLNDFRNQKIEEYKQLHDGIEPRGEDLENINRESDNVGNSSFILNTALLSATNYIQFPKILGSSYRSEKGMINSLKTEISEVVKDATGQLVKQQPKNRLLSNINKIRPYLFSTSEGFEEGAQFAISIGTQDYYNKRYDGEVASLLSSLYQGIATTVGTDEGMENILIGGLSGSIMLGRGRFLEAAAKSKNTAEAVQKFNKWKLSDFTKSTIDSVNRGTILQQEREAYLRQGDILESKEKEEDYIINYLTPRIKYGRFDLVEGDIAEYKALASTDEGFAQLQAEEKVLPGDTKQAYLQRLSNLERTAENIKSLYQSLQLRYGGLRTADGKEVYSSEVIDKMIYAATKVADYDKRIPELTLSLIGKGIAVDDITSELLEGKVVKFGEATELINKLDLNSDIKEDLLQNLKDVSELVLRRQQFLEEYDNIKNTPDKFKEEEIKPDIPVTGEKVIVESLGEEELEVGVDYFAETKIEVKEIDKPIKKYATFRVKGKEENGDVIIVTPDGKSHRIKKEAFKKYRLSKVSDVKTSNAKTFIAAADRIFTYNKGKKGENPKGHITYESATDSLWFESFDGKDRIKITREDLIPQINKKTGVKYDVAKVYTTEKFTEKEQEEINKPVTIEGKLSTRNKIIVNLYTSNKAKLEEVSKELENTKSTLVSLKEKLDAIFLTKKGNARKKITTGKDVINALSKEKLKAEQRIATLEEQKEELESTLPYLQDLVENVVELPREGSELLKHLKEDVNTLETLIDKTNEEITQNKSFLKSIEEALEEAFSLLSDFVRRLQEENPKIPLSIEAFQEQIERFLGEEGAKQFIEQREGFTNTVLDLQEQVEGFTEELKIPELPKKAEALRQTIRGLEKRLDELITEQIAKAKVLEAFEYALKEYKTKQEEEQKVKDNQEIQDELIGTGDTSLQSRTYSNDYEADNKKSKEHVIFSTKPATTSDLPHHKRSNLFGAYLDGFKNRRKIKGVIVTSKNEEQLGLKGLMVFLKGTSTVDPDKTIAMVMVEESEDGKPILVGVNGQPLTEEELKDPFNHSIYQVFPDPVLTWSGEFGGKSMFREDVAEEVKDAYRAMYKKWVGETLEKPTLEMHAIEASFGNPVYIERLSPDGKTKERDYSAVVSLEEAGLISESDLENSPLLEIGSSDVVTKKTTSFKNAIGRVFLSLPTTFVKLQNRHLTKKEAETVYEAVHQLAIDVFENKNAKSEKSLRLIKWLKSIVYWGLPKNEAGTNSVFFKRIDDGFYLFLSGKGAKYLFTPSELENNKAEIITLLQGMYNNVNSGIANKSGLWQKKYEEITGFTKNGDPITTEWANYQTFLLSRKGRKDDELPLFTQMKRVKDKTETNREGIYFTLVDSVESFTPPVIKDKITPKVATPEGTTPPPAGEFTLDGTTPNTIYLNNKMGKVIFTADESTYKVVEVNGEKRGMVNFEIVPLDAETTDNLLKKFGTLDEVKRIVQNFVNTKVVAQIEAKLATEKAEKEPPITKESKEEDAKKAAIAEEQRLKEQKEALIPILPPLPKFTGDDLLKANLSAKEMVKGKKQMKEADTYFEEKLKELEELKKCLYG